MIEVLATHDPVELSWAQAVLEAHGVWSTVYDAHVNAAEGSISPFPRRLATRRADGERAKAILAEARRALA